MEAMNGRNTAKGQQAAMLACNLTVVLKEPFTLCFGMGKGGTAGRRALPTPRTLQGMLHKYQRLLAVGSQAFQKGLRCALPVPWPSRPGSLLHFAPICHNNKLQGTRFLVQVYLPCVHYILALDFSIKSSIRV